MMSSVEYENLESLSLVWLDPKHQDSQETVDVQQQLRKSINHLKIFSNGDECVKYIQSISSDRIVMIVSADLAEEILPCIHQLRQVASIYIHCLHNNIIKQWIDKYKKVYYVF